MKIKQVTIEMPVKFYELLEEVCKIKEQSVSEFIVEGLIGSPDSELQDNLGNHLGFPMEGGDYRDYIEPLAWPEEAAQEVQV